MSIGLCCQYIEKKVSSRGKESYVNIFEEKNLQYGRYQKGLYTEDNILEIWKHNISKVLEILPKIHKEGIKSFRLSSNYFPLHDSVNKLLVNNSEIISICKKIGDFALNNNIRLTCHPDQFVVLSSKNSAVIDTAKRMLAHHAWMLDSMGLPETPYYAINIHGGVKGELKTLVDQTNNLPNNIKKRLTFENDERAYSVKDLHQVFQETGVPIVMDTHHHSFFNDGLSIDDALKISMSTWDKFKPLTHLSNTEPGFENGSFNERRKHSNYIKNIPGLQQELNDSGIIDIDFEAKMKQLAIFRAVEDLGVKL